MLGNPPVPPYGMDPNNDATEVENYEVAKLVLSFQSSLSRSFQHNKTRNLMANKVNVIRIINSWKCLYLNRSKCSPQDCKYIKKE